MDPLGDFAKEIGVEARRRFWGNVRGTPAFRRFASVVAAAALAASIAVVGEQALERRDAARLTADDTFSRLGGRRVRYLLAGADQPGPPVVLVTGLGGTIEQWHAVQPALARVAPVLTYDRGGQGFSDDIDAHDSGRQVEELHDLLGDVGLKGPFVVVAYSASAWMVRLFQARYPQLVAALVFLDPIAPKGTLATRRAIGTCTVEAFFGIMRLKGWWAHGGKPRTHREEIELAEVANFHHWLATFRGLWVLGDWTGQLMSASPVSSVPVAVATTYDPEHGAAQREAFKRSRQLTERESRGIFDPIRVDHSRLAQSEEVTAFVARIEAEARKDPSATEGSTSAVAH